MTYDLCLSQINRKLKEGSCDLAYQNSMQEKIDVFLLGNRITTDQWKELNQLLWSVDNSVAAEGDNVPDIS